MTNTRRALLYLVLVFLLGMVLGGLASFWVHERGWLRHWWAPGGGYHRNPVERLTRELDLSPEQQQQLEVILEETASGYRAIRERVRPDYEQVRQAGREKIRAILREDQRGKFEELVRRSDEKRERRREQRERERQGR